MIARRSIKRSVGLASVGVAAFAFVIAGCGADRDASRPATVAATAGRTTSLRSSPPTAAPAGAPARRRPPSPPFAVGLRILTFIDNSRLVHIPRGGLMPRKLLTVIRYPAVGRPTRADVSGAPPEHAGGPFPLVVFGHGFAVTPAIYASLLHALARAGYVVAAPLFPLENANAPGGPNESDLVNQPRDMSLVISRMLAASTSPDNLLSGLIDRRAIAVAGQSDGGETALAAAYDRRFLDRRIRAAVILSGAEIPALGGFVFPASSPPLLATQGTADVVNPPSLTHAFFDLAPAPKYLLTLFGASHLGPYTGQQPQLGIVERVTIAFLDRYLKGAGGAGLRLVAAGDVPGRSALQADR